MTRVLSTYLFLKRRLTPALVADVARFGITHMELFCARSHFDYRSGEAIAALASALADRNLTLHSIHAPSERDFNLKRDSSVPLSICDLERVRRLEAVDEIKRALDIAERIPFRYLVQHLGSSRDSADPRRFDAAFNSMEHLHLFAKQRGVTIALENTPGELATPANLKQFIADTRLTELRLCIDVGHAHLGDGVVPSIETMRDLVVTTHIHDNRGEKDDHLLPFDGTIDWKAALPALPADVPLVLELKEQPQFAEPAPHAVALEAARASFDKIEQQRAEPQRHV